VLKKEQAVQSNVKTGKKSFPNVTSNAIKIQTVRASSGFGRQSRRGSRTAPRALTMQGEPMMRSMFLLVLLALTVSAGCTRTPYSSPGKDLGAVDDDYTDCYSQAALTANTPPFPDSPLRVVDREADACMTGRGYQSQFRLF
jgi:hypothetical protein